MLYRRIWQGYNHRVICFKRFFSTVQNVEPVVKEEEEPKKTPRKCKNVSVSSEVISHLGENNLEHYLKFIPKKLLRKTNSKKNSVFLVNCDTAEKFCSLIADDLLKNTSHVIENNPGLGLLTEKLLEIGVPTVNVYEKNSSFLVSESPLLDLFDKYKTRLVLKELSFTDIWLKAIRDVYEEENLSVHYLEDAPHLHWKDKTYAQIILFIPDRLSLAMIIYNFFNQTSLFTHGRPVFYIGINSVFWERFTVTNKETKMKRFYLQYNVLLNLFFDYQYLGELPRQSFLPWPISGAKAKVNQLSIPMAVIKIEPKKNAFQVLDRENIRPFWFFLKQCMRSAKVRVIEQMETLAPGFGETLIEKNIDITTTFKELSPQTLLEIFKSYRASPKYDESTFMPNKEPKEPKNEEEKQQAEESTSEPQASL